LPFVLVDATGAHSTLPFVKQALRRGGAAVTPNKRNLAGAQSDFDELVGSGRMYFETTVGAGLPVIRPLQDLLATGDEVERIEGVFSGTLGFICSELQKGRKFSEIVTEAKAKGFTEPDPRDDLSGMDVARKVIILARLMGRRLEPEAVKLEGLYPDRFDQLSVEEFMKELPSLDAEYARRHEEAAARGLVLRYVATVTPTEATVGLLPVDSSTDIGQLSGPDNIVVIQTKRYHDNKLVVKGPGAGAEVTAAGVFADILASMRERHD
jgi:aspartokinase/homoserine dehydrogenase 1